MKEKKVTKYTSQSTPITRSKTSSVNNTALQLWSIKPMAPKNQLMAQLLLQKNQKARQAQCEAGVLQSTSLFNECNFCYNEAHTILWERCQEKPPLPPSSWEHTGAHFTCATQGPQLCLPSASASQEPMWMRKVLHRPRTCRAPEPSSSSFP